MKLLNKYRPFGLYAVVALLSTLLLSSCGSYTNAGFDGIYADQGQNRLPNQSDQSPANSDEDYQEYFATQSKQLAKAQEFIERYDEDSVFTDAENYSSTQNYAAQGEPQYSGDYYADNGAWGSNPSSVNVNVYGGGYYNNPYINYGFYDYWYGRPYYSYYYSPYYRYEWGWGWPYYGYGFGLGFGGIYWGYNHYYPYYPSYPYYPRYGYANTYRRAYHANRRDYKSGVYRNYVRRNAVESTRSRRSLNNDNGVRRRGITTSSRRAYKVNGQRVQSVNGINTDTRVRRRAVNTNRNGFYNSSRRANTRRTAPRVNNNTYNKTFNTNSNSTRRRTYTPSTQRRSTTPSHSVRRSTGGSSSHSTGSRRR